MTFAITLLVVFLASTVSSASKAPCCYPKQFTALQESTDTVLFNGTVTTYEGRTKMAYDAINELVSRIDLIYNAVTGVTVEEKIIYDYKNKKKYIIEDGYCTLKSLSQGFNEQCIPSIAYYDGTFAIGLGDGFQVSAFHFFIPSGSPSYDLTVQYMVEADGCVPYHLLMYPTKRPTKGNNGGVKDKGLVSPNHPLFAWLSTPTAGPYQKVRSFRQYSDYQEGIKDPSYWFDPPPDCHRDAKESDVGPS